MSVKFAMKDLGLLHYFLGIEVHRTSSGLVLTQGKYAMDLLKKDGMTECKPFDSPTALRTSQAPDPTPFTDPSSYRSIVGSLQYLTITRPDLSFAVNQACQSMHQPTISDWHSVKRILRYVKATLFLGLQFQSSPLSLLAYSDSD